MKTQFVVALAAGCLFASVISTGAQSSVKNSGAAVFTNKDRDTGPIVFGQTDDKTVVCPLPDSSFPSPDSTCITYAELKRLFKKDDASGLPYYSILEWKLKQSMDEIDQLQLEVASRDIRIGSLISANLQTFNNSTQSASANRQSTWLSQFEFAHPGKTFDFGTGKVVDKPVVDTPPSSPASKPPPTIIK